MSITDGDNRETAAGSPPQGTGSANFARPEITVRVLGAAEHEVAGQILGLAFADKYGPALGDDPQVAAEVAAILPPGGIVYLALVDNQPAGTATLRRQGDPGFGWTETARMWDVMKTHLGTWGAMRGFFIMSLMEGGGAVDSRTGYVAAVGVFPHFRNLGVGGAMLERIERDARAMGLRRLALHVVDNNHGARRLYERYGYRVQKTSRRLFARSIWSFGGSHYMVKELL